MCIIDRVSGYGIANATVVASWTATSSSSLSAPYYYSPSANLSSTGFAVDLSSLNRYGGYITVTNTGAATSFVGSSSGDSLVGGSGPCRCRRRSSG